MSYPAPPQLAFPEGVVLLGGGPFDPEDLVAALARAPRLVCADGGADALGGLTPDAIVGDMDSVVDAARWRAALGDRFVQVAEQDSTDLEKCLRLTAAPLFIGVGFAGGRADHFLAALHALVGDPRPVILISADDVIFAAHRPLRLRLAPGDRVSIFPVAPVRARRGAGLRWPIDGLEMRAGETIGTSNEAASEIVEAEFDGAGAVVILPRARLDNAIEALRLPSGDAAP
ncbi:MAG: thiamine diphosphokinase [Pseudomonadota bacterium]